MGDSQAGDGSAPHSEERPSSPPQHSPLATDHGPRTTDHSPLGRILRLTRKELSEVLRDRRTIVTLVAMPLLLCPLLSAAFLQFASIGKADSERGMKYFVGFSRTQEAHLFFDRLQHGARALREGQDKEGPAAPEIVDQLGTPDELQEALRAGKIDLIVRIPGAEQVVRGDEEIAPGQPILKLNGRD